MSEALIEVLYALLRIYELVVLGSIIASWVGADPDNVLVRALRSLSEPLLARIRVVTRKLPGPLDWSPAVLLIGVHVVKDFLGPPAR